MVLFVFVLALDSLFTNTSSNNQLLCSTEERKSDQNANLEQHDLDFSLPFPK